MCFFLCCRWPMVDMQVDYMKPTQNISVGIYGWRKRCLYCLLIVLIFIVAINLCLTFWLSVALGLHWVRSPSFVLLVFSAGFVRLQGSIGPISIFKNHVIFRSPVVFKDGLIANKIFSGEQVLERLASNRSIRFLHFRLAIEYSIRYECTYPKWFRWKTFNFEHRSVRELNIRSRRFFFVRSV